MARSILAAAAIFIFFTAESARNWSSNRELWWIKDIVVEISLIG